MDDKKQINQNPTNENLMATGGPAERIDELGAELRQMKQWRSDVDLRTIRAQRDLKTCGEETASVRRQMLGVGILVAVMACALIAGTWLGYNRIRLSEQAMATLPTSDELVDLVDARVDFVAEMLDDFSAEGEVIQGLRDQVAALERSIQEGLTEAETRTQLVAARIGERVRLEVLSRFEEIRPTLVRLAASQEAQGTEIDQLQQELEGVRADLSTQLAELRRGQMDTAFGLSQVSGRVRGNERALDAVSYEIGRQKIGFELYRDLRQEIAPGLALNVSDIDVGYQKVDGWLHLEDEGRILRIEDHAIQRSLVFYSMNDDRSYEVVFTRVTPDAAFGYVVVPTENGLDVVERVQDPAFEELLARNP